MAQTSQHADCQTGDPSVDELTAVVSMTLNLFGGDVSMRLVDDPESGDRYFAVVVKVSGSDEEVLQKARQWHRQMAMDFATQTVYSLSPTFD